MIRNTVARAARGSRAYATINTGTVPAKKSHKFRNRLLALTVSLGTVYGVGVVLDETDSRYAAIYNDNIPFANDVLDTVDDIKSGNFSLPELSWDKLSEKYSALISQGTLGIPTHRPRGGRGDEGANLLQLKQLDTTKIAALDPRFNTILNEVKHTVQTMNNQQIPLTASQTEVLTDCFNELFAAVAKYNDGISDQINDAVVKGSQDRVDQFKKEYEEKTAEKEKQLDRKYEEKFETFKSVLEENVTKLLETSLESNLQTLQAKQANEIALLSITQVQEFNKIIEEKVEQERNAKLANLQALDERVSNVTKSIANFGNILTKNQVITRLSLMANDIKSRLESNDFHSIDLDANVARMKMISQAMPRAGCGCKSGKCKCKKCTGSCATKSAKTGEKLLDVTIGELATLTKDGPVLSNEQLFNRWNLLESDFKTASLLPPNAGILGHLTAKFFSIFLFSKKGISASSDDLDALFARVQTNLETAKLENAIEDAVSLNGWPRVLCEQWIKDARRKLEMEALIDVLDAELKVL